MQVRLISAALAEVPCRARTPFRFGATTVTGAPLLHARVAVEDVAGRRAEGMAADLLVPKWFAKDPAATAEQDQEALRASARAAAATMLAQQDGHATPFEHWWRCHAARVEREGDDQPDLLVRGFGVALFERALLDATCRLAGRSFWSSLQRDLFGFVPERLHAELRGEGVAAALPERPRTTFWLRHTVGMLDPLRDRDVAAPVGDGEPESLEAELRTRRPRWLKVKVGSGLDADRARLLAIARLLDEHGRDVRLTLDGNEQFASMDELAELLDAVAGEPAGRELLARTAFVEQPLPRAATFDAAANAGIDRVTGRLPLCLDEADGKLSSFPRALALGWRGCSVKDCKGVFRALGNFLLARARGDGAFQSAEDLTNLPLLALQQDLCTVGALGLEHVERNGHHYFAGLRHLPAAVQDAALAAHGDLYERRAVGAALRIDDGRLRADSLLGPGYGCDEAPFGALMAALDWQPVGG